MSKANRKMVYDKLVKENRHHDISAPLIKEFGNPKAEEVKPVELPKAKPKKAKTVE